MERRGILLSKLMLPLNQLVKKIGEKKLFLKIDFSACEKKRNDYIFFSFFYIVANLEI